MSGVIAYVMSRFPHLPETFILREMDALEDLGWEIALYPLIRQQQSVTHDQAQRWVDRACISPFFSGEVLWSNLNTLFHKPVTYIVTAFRVVWENILNPKFLLRALVLFPKAVHMATQMSQEKVDHIHAHYATHPALVAWIINQLSGISYSVTVHAHDIYVHKTMLKTKLGDATFLIPISEFNRRYLENEVGISVKNKAHVIHCGIDPDWYSDGEGKNDSENVFSILNIGSLQTYKGQKYLLEACSILAQRGVPIHCKIIGEGEQRAALEAYIAAKKLESYVTLMGALSQEDVARLIPRADCYIQPSVIDPSGKMEGIPVAIMEAFAAGIPVIATDISGISELVQPNLTGFLVPERDAGALADAIQAVYDDLDYSRKLASRGQELVLSEFNLKNNVNRLSLKFNQIVAEQT